jgi:hypothetical protein
LISIQEEEMRIEEEALVRIAKAQVAEENSKAAEEKIVATIKERIAEEEERCTMEDRIAEEEERCTMEERIAEEEERCTMEDRVGEEADRCMVLQVSRQGRNYIWSRILVPSTDKLVLVLCDIAKVDKEKKVETEKARITPAKVAEGEDKALLTIQETQIAEEKAIKEMRIAEEALATEEPRIAQAKVAADRPQSNFVAITRRGTNTNSDSCFFYPTCTSSECGCCPDRCEFHKQWKEIIENEEDCLKKKKEAATTAAGGDRCYFYPVCTSQKCSGQREDCKIHKDWIEAVSRSAVFVRRKIEAKRKQRNERTADFRAANKKLRITT